MERIAAKSVRVMPMTIPHSYSTTNEISCDNAVVLETKLRALSLFNGISTSIYRHYLNIMI